MTSNSTSTLPDVVRFSDDASYRADPGYNFSTIKAAIPGKYGTSLADLRADLDNPTPFKRTPAMELGTLVHSLVLEPDTVSDQYLVTAETDRRRKAYKEAKAVADAEGLTLVTEADMAKARAMATAVELNEEWAMLKQKAGEELETECGMAVNDPLLGGLRYKGKFDALFGGELMVDVKTTTESLDLDNLSALIVNRNMHVQQALYWRILRQVRPELSYHLPKMAWLFVRSTGAFDTVLVYASDDIMEHAELLLNELLEDIARAEQENYWPPAHPGSVAVATLPRWVKLPDVTYPDSDATVSPLPL